MTDGAIGGGGATMKKLLFLLIGLSLFLIVIIIRDFRKQEYTCLSPEEIARCKKYQMVIDKLYNESWSWLP